MKRQIFDITPVRATDTEKLRVAAYARVSCGKDTMLHSLAAQVDYYHSYIMNHIDWTFCGVYADEAKTGTKDDREQFQKLLSDCRHGLVNMVITKSISRFARNTVTLLATVRELKELGIDVFFEDQNIHSISEEGELMLTLMASQAQEESLSCSENCKWRIRKGFEQGQANTCTMLGYRLVNGDITLVPEEAKIAKEIFSLYLSGYGVQKIANTLNEHGVQTDRIPYWHPDTIRGILRNEKYVGDLLLQKTMIESHLTKKQVQNVGQLRQFYISEDHEPIVSREDFSMVQEEITRRAKQYGHKRGSKSVLTGKIQCAICGKNYRRKTTAHNIVWCCSTFNDKGKAYCSAKVIPEETLKASIAAALELTEFTEDAFLASVHDMIAMPNNRLSLALTDGTNKEIIWKDRSRSERWTEEMREAARQKTLQRKELNK